MFKFSPAHSLILDLDDCNWSKVLTEQELEELRGLGKPLVRNVPQELQEVFDQIELLVCISSCILNRNTNYFTI